MDLISKESAKAEMDKLMEIHFDRTVVLGKAKDKIESLPSAFEGMTNGEVIQALFPDIENWLNERTGIMLVKWADGTTKTFKANWWNAPYKAESEDKKCN